jgi:CubicO group peptidase (beta-lactamase class C family)
MKFTALKITLLVLLISPFQAKSQNLYFPPLNPALAWDTVSPTGMGWCTAYIDSLYDFLEQENTKAFIVLKDGKIALEKYFGTFTTDSLWYWASAGKTLTAFLTGKAQEEGFLSLNDSSSRFLGSGWTDCNATDEGKITIFNQLTMTSGLDEAVPDDDCTIDTCLQCIAPAGTRWAYHNAPYTLLEEVVSNATGQSYNTYTQNKLEQQTGMNGFWLTVGFNNVYFSNARSMARFGILIQNKCIWNQDTLLDDTAYVNQMTSTSQNLNLSYGYLWWLNGKASYMVPGLQLTFPGSYAPSAPSDMYSAIGKNGQILSIAPSLGLVVVRLGDVPGSQTSSVPTLFCDQIWFKLNQVICSATATQEIQKNDALELSPNPAGDIIQIRLKNQGRILAMDINGKKVLDQDCTSGLTHVDIRNWPKGVYFIHYFSNDNITMTKKLLRL